MFANAEMQVPSAMILGGKTHCSFKAQTRLARRTEVRRTAHQPGMPRADGVENFPRGVARRHSLFVFWERGNVRVPALRQLTVMKSVKFIREFGILGAEILHPREP